MVYSRLAAIIASDFWCIIGGKTNVIPDYGSYTVTLPKHYKNINYNITLGIYTPGGGDDTQWNNAAFIRNNTKTINSFVIYSRGAVDGGRSFDYKTEGYI